MANDRVYLKCKYCGKRQLFFKYYPTGNPSMWSPEAVNNFIGEHGRCSPNYYGGDLNGDCCFELEADSSIKSEVLNVSAK